MPAADFTEPFQHLDPKERAAIGTLLAQELVGEVPAASLTRILRGASPAMLSDCALQLTARTLETLCTGISHPDQLKIVAGLITAIGKALTDTETPALLESVRSGQIDERLSRLRLLAGAQLTEENLPVLRAAFTALQAKPALYSAVLASVAETLSLPLETLSAPELQDTLTLASAARKAHLPAQPEPRRSWAKFVERVNLEILARLQHRPELNEAERELWDRAAQDVRGYDMPRLKSILRNVLFDPGGFRQLLNIPSDHQELLASCPGVPEGRLKITSVRAATIAVTLGTPTARAVLNTPRFAHLAAANPALPLQDAINLALSSGNAQGLTLRKMPVVDQLEAFLQTSHLNLKHPLKFLAGSLNEISDDLSDADILAVARRIIRTPGQEGLWMITRWQSRLPTEVNAVLTVLANIYIGKGYTRQMLDAETFESGSGASLRRALEALAGA